MALPEKIGKYRVIRELGKGATAIVYLCDDPDRTEPVAVKVVSFGDSNKDEGKWSRRMKKLFMTEAQVAKRLDHPNIIHIYDAAVEDDRAYLVMEYIDGRALDEFCTFDKLLPVHVVVGMVFKCCLALDYAYRQGIIHRDIKPANILIGENDLVKITDFGLAMNVGREVAQESTFIMGVGSPAYMSPEQIKGYPLNQKTDLYSLGVVLFHLMTGRLPFRAKHPAQLIYRIINADPPSASHFNPDVPEAMDAIIRKALEKDLYSRYRNGAEFAKELSSVRFKILDENYVAVDTSRFSILRKMAFFLEFEDVEIWEVLRFSVWKRYDPDSVIMREGETETRFGLIVEGKAEVAINGHRVAMVGPNELIGELSYLDQGKTPRVATVITRSTVVLLEISPAALDIASEECLDRFRQQLVSSVVRRFATAAQELAKYGPEVDIPKPVEGKELALDFELVPMETPNHR
ncbi:MAG: protein kinase [Rhodocyclaceae bacterium]|nr:protein kinase [Rhodocyclaceae bacterium]